MKILLPSLLAPLLLLASCASDSSADKKNAASSFKPLSQRMNEKNGFSQDSDGKWVSNNDKRSQFENQADSQFAGKSFKKKEFKTGEYKKTAWAGNKQFTTRDYAGNTDASRFKTTSPLQGRKSREAGTAANLPSRYQTNRFATNSAREDSKENLAKPSNDAIENRRASFIQPKIVDWQQQRSITMDQSKSLLGR